LKAAAIFGPRASWKDVEPFSRASGIITQTGTPPAKADAVLIFGGDGTVHRHLAKVVEHQLPTLVVPGGSGNDFARSLGITTLDQAVAAWRDFVRDGTNVRTIDVGVITPLANPGSIAPQQHSEKRPAGLLHRFQHVASNLLPSHPAATAKRDAHLFCCVGGAGFDADANRRANAMPWWMRAHGGYAIAAVRTLMTWKPVRMRVELPDTGITLDEPASFVVFANAPSYGDGMRIAPHAVLDDGLLDICFVRGTSKARIVSNFASIYSGSHLSLREVEYFQASRVRIEAERPMDVYADGEYVCRTPIEVRLRPSALKVIVGR
jgi:diacylglycerol kinase (ATP)